MNNIFEKKVADKVISRIERLDACSKPLWGKMSVDKMLAHCNVTYELVYEDKHPRPGPVKKFFLKLFVKSMVVSEKPYRQNGPTAPEFKIQDPRNFELEKARLISYIKKTQELGEDFFDHKESHSFGRLTKAQWSLMFYKHLDHHLNQFGV